MSSTDKVLIHFDGVRAGVVTQPADGDIGTAVPCTYHNATNRTVFIWHWPRTDALHRAPCFVRTVAAGQSVTIYYMTRLFARATYAHDFRYTLIEESTVGDIPRHVSLLSEPDFALAI